MNNDVQVVGKVSPEFAKILTPEALAFIAALQREFNPTREALLEKRAIRQAELDAGSLPVFLSETKVVRRKEWTVAPTPPDLQDRRVEITGPVDRKLIINALNSGANIFKADFEDALSPTWKNVVQGQANLMDAVRQTIEYTSSDGTAYRLKDNIATLIVRPRGWHLIEKHVLVDGQPISASLFDFGLYFFHNALELLDRNTGPYFYLPKIESYLEARLWNEVFNFAQDTLSIPRGTVRATVLIENILAAFEMEEILYELREHVSGLNAGRWDYIFSVIKKFRNRADFILPDRDQITMTVPFMQAYTESLVRTCHHRGAHAIGGMSAYIPNRRNSRVNEIALAEIREDKEREVHAGFDGAWVAHPDLVPSVKNVFDQVLKTKPHQKDRLREDVQITAQDLLDVRIPGGKITKPGLHNNISIILQYLESWLRGIGAVAIHNLMEDVATAEIARTQLWQWIRNGAHLDSGASISEARYKSIRSEELDKLGSTETARYQEAAEILDQLILNKEFIEFLTVPAYDYLD